MRVMFQTEAGGQDNNRIGRAGGGVGGVMRNELVSHVNRLFSLWIGVEFMTLVFFQ